MSMIKLKLTNIEQNMVVDYRFGPILIYISEIVSHINYG